MLITNVRIKNFRCYYGENDITFNANNKITLIYGDSGYGKSSFLQFFRWMFYNDPEFGKDNDKPLFNIAAFNETDPGQMVEVSGRIDFEHVGNKYRLTKTQYWSRSFQMSKSLMQKNDYALQIDTNDGTGYHPYNGDIANKINNILPKGLSKYFLLDGERSREIVLESNQLKKAIHALFGIDAYTEAISHIGSRNSGTSVWGHYSKVMAQKMSGTINNMSIAEMQENIQELYEDIENNKAERREVIALIEQKNARRDEIFKTLGAAASKNNIEELIKANNKAIKQQEDKISGIRQQIGNLFYSNYPYLFLTQVASNCSTVLRNKNHEYASNYHNIFENLKKDLLKEILQKDMCVCGRALDDETKTRIEAIIDIMPPGSYMYEFGQFVAKAKRFISTSRVETMKYESFISQILACEAEIARLEDLNKEKLDELKRLDDAKDLVEELEQIKVDLDALGKKKSGYEGTIAKKKQVYDISNKKLREIINNAKVSGHYHEILAFFEEIVKTLKDEKLIKEQQVRVTINSCVRDVFKKLTTQTELDVDKIEFVNDDFSLRTTYLTGGQLAVDVYSYVIGIVKALQECQMENNENPIIIDAPFAFTGNDQSEHLFRTLPSVSKQTILLTLDLNKIKKLLDDTTLYDFYIIDNATQDKAIIRRGDINAIKF